jgi:hypothetical protein
LGFSFDLRDAEELLRVSMEK